MYIKINFNVYIDSQIDVENEKSHPQIGVAFYYIYIMCIFNKGR